MAKTRKKKRISKRKPAKKKVAKKTPAKRTKQDPKTRERGELFKKGGKGGPGRKKGVPNKISKEAKGICVDMLTDPEYIRSLARRLHGGTLAPGMETMVWYYGFGKPIERIKHSGDSFATIVNGVMNRPDPESDIDK